MKVTDEWLYEKMPIVDAAMVRQLEVCTQKDYVFSDKFRKRMKRLIQKEKYMYAEKQLKKITQKIAQNCKFCRTESYPVFPILRNCIAESGNRKRCKSNFRKGRYGNRFRERI